MFKRIIFAKTCPKNVLYYLVEFKQVYPFSIIKHFWVDSNALCLDEHMKLSFSLRRQKIEYYQDFTNIDRLYSSALDVLSDSIKTFDILAIYGKKAIFGKIFYLCSDELEMKWIALEGLETKLNLVSNYESDCLIIKFYLKVFNKRN